ncbi:MAG: low-specificity L-threonine aldolase [SAR324 cluster bacterium]|nr:low-specificity L-threonine aldolase [SAR324 cluster bacterium]
MHNGIIDLRSDTVTRPNTEMRKAMAEAEVGDDVYGEDPTINALQEEVAEMFGKEAALFVPSGTMANQICLKAHTQPGDEVIIHPWAHIMRAESGAGAALSSVQFRPVGNPDGSMDVKEVAASIQSGENPHHAPTRLICMENTHNFAGGAVVPVEGIDAVAAVAKENGLAMHLDGARVLNAAVVLDVRPDKIASNFDSGTLCFSKGLGAPVGSIIYGTKDFVNRCLRFRKMFGGGLRQAGILAAAARHALKHNVERLAEDHNNAKLLAAGFEEIKNLSLPKGMPESNLLFFSCGHPKISTERFVAGLKEEGILIGAPSGDVARAVTHLDISREDVEQTIDAARRILNN